MLPRQGVLTNGALREQVRKKTLGEKNKKDPQLLLIPLGSPAQIQEKLEEARRVAEEKSKKFRAQSAIIKDLSLKQLGTEAKQVRPSASQFIKISGQPSGNGKAIFSRSSADNKWLDNLSQTYKSFLSRLDKLPKFSTRSSWTHSSGKPVLAPLDETASHPQPIPKPNNSTN